jgi:putative transposase
MPRTPRVASLTGYYHFINRGVNKRHLFHRKADYLRYLNLISEYSTKLDVKLHHYCLMPNHTHLLLHAGSVESLSRFGHFIQRNYAYYYCKTHNWSEQVFRNRFKSIPIESDGQFLECARYIERNPLDLGYAGKLANYPYSSYAFYALNEPNNLIEPSIVYQGLGESVARRAMAYRVYVETSRSYESTDEKAQPVAF